MFILDSFGRKIPINDANFVESVIKLKQKSGSKPWPVIEALFNYWASKNPREYQSFIINIENIRKTRKDPKYGSSTDKETGGILRYTLDIPQEVMFMLRKVYDVDELPMDREFFIEFARRFPRFKVAQKL